MNHLNTVLLEGVLTADPRQVNYDGSNTDNRLVKFDIASDRYYTDRQGNKKVETLFIPVQAWGPLADKSLTKLKKGMTCRVSGRLRMTRWASDDGTVRKSYEIAAEYVEYRIPRSMMNAGQDDAEPFSGDSGYNGAFGEPEAVYRA